MARSNWNQRFFSSTRGRILTLLRREKRTVEDLAGELTLTDNAVRAHLATLERDFPSRARACHVGRACSRLPDRLPGGQPPDADGSPHA